VSTTIIEGLGDCRTGIWSCSRRADGIAPVESHSKEDGDMSCRGDASLEEVIGEQRETQPNRCDTHIVSQAKEDHPFNYVRYTCKRTSL
jgi:hypothetical protein